MQNNAPPLGQLLATLRSLDAASLEEIRRALFTERTQAVCPSRMFMVSPDIKHLPTAQLERLTRVVEAWRDKASTLVQQRSRDRVWLVFMVIRHGALKLGEAFALCPWRDFEPETCSLRVEGDTPRVVQLPREVFQRLQAVLASPAMAGLPCGRPGQDGPFAVDPGYMRKKMYALGETAGLPKDLCTPMALRHSRAVELLRNGMPIKMVQMLLGHQSLALTSQYVQYKEEDARRIMPQYIAASPPLKTSARNRFPGVVQETRRRGLLADVVLDLDGGQRLEAAITVGSLETLRLAPGRRAVATVKAPWVRLSPAGAEAAGLATRHGAGGVVNRLEGAVLATRRDEQVQETIVALAGGGEICAISPLNDPDTEAFLGSLQPDVRVAAGFTATEVILHVEPRLLVSHSPGRAQAETAWEDG